MKEKCAAGVLSLFCDLEDNWRASTEGEVELSLKLEQLLLHLDHECLQIFLTVWKTVYKDRDSSLVFLLFSPARITLM